VLVRLVSGLMGCGFLSPGHIVTRMLPITMSAMTMIAAVFQGNLGGIACE
jgi:hypothetical protein